MSCAQALSNLAVAAAGSRFGRVLPPCTQTPATLTTEVKESVLACPVEQFAVAAMVRRERAGSLSRRAKEQPERVVIHDESFIKALMDDTAESPDRAVTEGPRHVSHLAGPAAPPPPAQRVTVRLSEGPMETIRPVPAYQLRAAQPATFQPLNRSQQLQQEQEEQLANLPRGRAPHATNAPRAAEYHSSSASWEYEDDSLHQQESQEDLYADESPCRRSSAEPRGVQQHQPSSSYYSSQQQQHADGPAPSDRTDRHHHRGRAVASTYSAQHAPQQRDEPAEPWRRATRRWSAAESRASSESSEDELEDEGGYRANTNSSKLHYHHRNSGAAARHGSLSRTCESVESYSNQAEEESRREPGPKQQQKGDTLYYSRKARPVNYEPYTLKDYRQIKPEGYYEIKARSLPDLQSDDLIAKRAVRDRVRDFSRRLKSINEKKIATQPRPDAGATKAPSKREKGLEFAKRIPRPKPASKPEPAAAASSSSMGRGNRRSSSSSGEGPEAEEEEDDGGYVLSSSSCSRIRELEAEHENARAQVAAIRKAFGSMLNRR